MSDNQPGALALVGSGEYLPEAQELEAELLRFGISRGKSNTYIQIPTAAGKEGDDRLDFWRQRGADQGIAAENQRRRTNRVRRRRCPHSGGDSQDVLTRTRRAAHDARPLRPCGSISR